jgi:microcystin-dependent protein
MAVPFIGEIRMFGGNFAPQDWAFCDGSLLSIAEYDTLFSLIGTTYGGDGQTTFALPDLRGRIPIHAGQGPGLSPHTLGEAGGTEAVALTTAQLLAHTHPLAAVNGVGTTPSPGGAVWAGVANGALYASGAPSGATMNANSIGAAGGGQPHDNLMPYQCISFIIALSGIFPSQN